MPRGERLFVESCSNSFCTSATAVKGSPFVGSTIPPPITVSSAFVRVRYETKYSVYSGPSFVLHYVAGSASAASGSTCQCVGVQNSTWNQVAVAVEPIATSKMQIRLLLNGTLVAEESSSLSAVLPGLLAIAGNDGIVLGRVDLSRAPYGYFSGRVSDLRIWNRARSQAEIDEDINQSCFDLTRVDNYQPSLTACFNFETNATVRGLIGKFADLGMLPKTEATVQSAAKALPWCTTLGDGGRLRNGREVDMGESWGFCTPKPRLPGLGFSYDSLEFGLSEEDLINLASLSAADVLGKAPTCGIKLLHFKENHAERLSQHKCFITNILNNDMQVQNLYFLLLSVMTGMAEG